MRSALQGFFNSHNRRELGESVLVLLNTGRIYSSAANTSLNKNSHDSSQNQRREQALSQHGLSGLKLVWPQTADTAFSDKIDYTHINPPSIRSMYSEADLSAMPIFQGGFINFGYWPKKMIAGEPITKKERIASSEEMYRLIGDLAQIASGQSIMDVGCGLGYGSAFLSKKYRPKLVVGVDITPDQIARAKRHQMRGIKDGDLRFTIGEAESLPFPESSFDRVISVEAAQHFGSLADFSKEVARVLKPNGTLIMTSFFPTNQSGKEALNAIVPDYHIHGSQHTIIDVQSQLLEFMENVKVKSIGENVWDGFSKWLDQIGYADQWSKIWPALYNKGLIDYVVYEATHPKKESSPEFRM